MQCHRLRRWDDDIDSSLGDVGNRRRGYEGEVEDGGMDREWLDPAIRQPLIYLSSPISRREWIKTYCTDLAGPALTFIFT